MGRRTGFGHKRKKMSGVKFVIGLVFSCFIIFITYTLLLFDDRIMPPVLASYKSHATTKINEVISNSLTKVITEKNLNSSDFYIRNVDEGGNFNSLSVNTVLINEVCNRIAEEISAELELQGGKKIPMPVGALLGLKILANIGPSYNITLLPAGSAVVDYGSKFESAGINQINFQVWLKIKSSVDIINPFQESLITVTRDVPLVNTVFSGEVPSTYFDIGTTP